MSTALPRFVVFGEALTDFVRTGDNLWRSVAGGSCWNVARVAATLGLETAWGGAVSDDRFGREIAALSDVAGLDPRFMQIVDRPPLIAMVHETHPPQYFFLGTGTADLAFDETALPNGWMDRCEIAHFGCISLVRQPLGQRLVTLAGQLKSRGVHISFDPNWRKIMGPDFPALVEHMCRLADIIKVSDEDLAQIYPGDTPEQSLTRLRGYAPQATVLYTRGAGGIGCSGPAGAFEQPAFAVPVADTVGAGDSCIGGYIASLLLRPDGAPAEHLRFAAATAAVVCMHAGAHAPTQQQVEALLHRAG